MFENTPISLQVGLIASGLGSTIQTCLHALEELRRISIILFDRPRPAPDRIRDWFTSENFGIDDDGFWTSLSLLRAARSGNAPATAISYSWHPDLVQNGDACFRMYSLRNSGSFLSDIRDSLPHAAWIYYQDVTNTSIQFPYIDQTTAITPDFDWSTYHTYVSVNPENNPERRIQWTSPTIDYAGEGLIISASIPVYLNDRFTGLWSIDLPLNSLYRDDVFDAYMKHQVNFIIDTQGLLITHPWVAAEIDRDKGSVYRCHVRELGSGFKDLDPERLIRKGSGQVMLSNEHENDTVVWFQSIPGIPWIFLATLPRQSMEDAVNLRIRKALDRVRSGDLSYRIQGISDVDTAGLVAAGFNQMADALENQERQRKQAQEEKLKLEKRLHHFQRMEAIGTLAGGIAHDFNNILFPILGYSELLFQDLPKDSDAYDMADQIYRAAIRAKELIRQILTFSRQTDMEHLAISFQTIVKEALKLLRASIPKNIEILSRISPDCPPVMGDPTKLHQIVMNLCTNAYHAVEEAGGRFEVSLEPVTLSAKDLNGFDNLPEGQYVRLTVADNGCGMDDQTLVQIFDPYFTTKTEGKGTGLGLAIIYGIVRQMKGDIKVYSEPGRGSSFQVFLPEAPQAGTHEDHPEPEIEMGTEHILLVDDENSIAHMEKQFLKRYGYRVTIFTDSRKALEAFSSDPHAFDLVITDMTMPELTGDVLAEKIKAVRQDIPVILCTGFSEKITSATYNKTAVDSFFMKPISFRALSRTIRRLLDRTSGPDRSRQ